MKLVRRAFLMLLAGVLIFWLTGFLPDVARYIIGPSHGMSCGWIRSQVEKYGQAAVEAEAKRRGMTDEQIEALRKRCGI